MALTVFRFTVSYVCLGPAHAVQAEFPKDFDKWPFAKAIGIQRTWPHHTFIPLTIRDSFRIKLVHPQALSAVCLDCLLWL